MLTELELFFGGCYSQFNDYRGRRNLGILDVERLKWFLKGGKMGYI